MSHYSYLEIGFDVNLWTSFSLWFGVLNVSTSSDLFLNGSYGFRGGTDCERGSSIFASVAVIPSTKIPIELTGTALDRREFLSDHFLVFQATFSRRGES